MAKSIDPDTAFMWQARFCYRGSEAASFTCATALRCNVKSDVVEIYALKKQVHVMVVGKLIAPSKQILKYRGGTLVWDVKDKAFIIECEQGTRMTVDVRSAKGDVKYLEVQTSLSNSLYQNVQGLLGSWNSKLEDDIVDRMGSVWNSGHGLSYVNGVDHPSLSQVQESWLVRNDAKESIFTLTPAESEADITLQPARRMRRRSLQSIRMNVEDMKTARTMCAKLGMTGPWIETCAFDAVMTGFESSFVRNHVSAVKKRQ